MTSNSIAIVTLLLYAAVIAAVVVWQYRKSGFDRRAWFLYIVERLHVGLMYHWRANQRCPFPESGPAIVIGNHRSPVDPMLIWMNNHLGSRNRRPRIINFVMAREYYEISGLRWLCQTMQSIPVDRQGRDMAPAREALDRLRQGHLLGIFPEGGINTNEGPELNDAETGIAWLALHSQVPVYPVFIDNSPRPRTMISPFLTPCRVHITYGPPIDLTSYAGRKKTRALLTEVTDLLMRRLAETGGVPYMKDVRPRNAQEVASDVVRRVRPTG